MSMPVIEVPMPDFVKRARARLGLSQREFAERLGLSRHSIIRYEQGWPLPERTKLAMQQLLDQEAMMAPRPKRPQKRRRA